MVEVGEDVERVEVDPGAGELVDDDAVAAAKRLRSDDCHATTTGVYSGIQVINDERDVTELPLLNTGVPKVCRAAQSVRLAPDAERLKVDRPLGRLR